MKTRDGGRTRYVYFARAGDMMKIGSSIQPVQRLKSIGEWVPYKIELVATVVGGFGLEAAFHCHFRASWSHLEWFHVTQEMENIITAINEGRPYCLNTSGELWDKRIIRALKWRATRRVNFAEKLAGRPYMYYERLALRPQYVIDAMSSYYGSQQPPPSEAALSAISRYEEELAAVRAA